jgi:uncharacterized membrane protein HdeD (DUF308 family)
MNAVNNGNASSKYWWIPLISGLTLLFFGLWFLLAPEESVRSVTIVFGLIILVSGAFEIYTAFNRRKTVINYLSFVWGGLLNVVLGVLLILNPETILWVISLLIGIWLIFKGGEQINRGFKLKKNKNPNWSRQVVFGVVLLVLGIVIIWHPEIIGFSIALWAALAFILIGVFRIYLALQYRKLK